LHHPDCGATAYDNSGEKIGKVGQLRVDDETGEATWVTMSTGLFGLSQSFAPLQGAESDGDDIRLKCDDAGKPGSTHEWTGKERSRPGTADADEKCTP
jgi:hypothetical protein